MSTLKKKSIKLIYFFIIVVSINVVSLKNSFSNEWWDTNISSPYLIGEGVLKVFVWDIYTLRLFSETKKFNSSHPLVLEFEYLRDTSKKSVIKASIKELKKLNIPKNKLLIWEKYLNNTISDMTKGEKAALYWEPGSQITFYVKERLKRIIKDKEFADAYINIWLGENTSRPILRDKIIGLKK